MKTHSVLALILSFFFCKEMKGQESTVIYPSADMWMGNVYATSAQNNNYVRIGGWGDRYFGFWKFDWNSVKKSKEIDSVMLYFYPDKKQNSYNQLVSSATMYLLSTTWNETTSRISDSIRGWNMGSFNLDRDSGLVLNITSLYEYWRDNPSWNYGFMLFPDQNNNKYYFFPSRESGSPDRTRVVVYYKEEIPDFKLPLNSKYWQLTTEAGGKSFDGFDENHTGKKYYSLDFNARSFTPPSISSIIEIDPHILAMKSGVVYETSKNTGNSGPNGNYVRIDHDGDSDPKTGFQSVYSHMRYPPIVNSGSVVDQGSYLGIMGNTGLSFGTHIHITIYHRGTAIGNGDDPILNKVTIEGKKLKDYKLSASKASFYKSTNIERK